MIPDQLIIEVSAVCALPNRQQHTIGEIEMAARKISKHSSQRKTSQTAPVVGVIMGSRSDWPTMKYSTDILKALHVPYETKIVSAHRTPARMTEYANSAKERGLSVIIAGAGGAAHLPGMVASMTTLPVLGVPVESKALSGMDSLLSIVQMPGGVPVGTLAIGSSGAKNAGILAVSIVALKYEEVASRLEKWRASLTDSVPENPVGR
ncbi:MAG: N5-carboxyaminoimidazole ribonucleotide mutase [Alphaproteobacteria bacterium MarineAlpha11_Bin1]|nr:MAG: N5-carboxyaminoimidazole ribonucleotide mutase [Alphaproteobacteria bacterium MarineAlpha11_Bin1]|tara:strand:+ start:7649 stop:8269 length:621 start_codon:yes stop_codon:yes gene_type:complete